MGRRQADLYLARLLLGLHTVLRSIGHQQVDFTLLLNQCVVETGILVAKHDQLDLQSARILILDQEVHLVGFPLKSHVETMNFVRSLEGIRVSKRVHRRTRSSRVDLPYPDP